VTLPFCASPMHPFRATVNRFASPATAMLTCLLAMAACLAPIMTWGQDQISLNTATLQGSVRDSAGHPISGATVYLQTEGGGQARSVKADTTGRYYFSALRDGIYMLRVEMNGFSPATFGPCVVVSGETKGLDLTLESPKKIPSQSASAPPGKASSGPPEFFDEPQFTVAGVTDGTNLGGHGSNTIVRTKDALAKDIVSLSGSAGQGSRKPEEATLRAEVEHHPDSFEANHRLGKSLVDDGRASESLVYLERASKLEPGDYPNSYLLAMAYADTGQYQRARANAQALLTAQSGDKKNQADLHHLLGDVEEKAGNPLDAVREYQRGAELNPSEANFFDWGAELLLHRAIEPAIEVFDKGNQLFPHSARLLVGLGVAWYTNGSYDQAEQRLCQASDLNPNDPKAYLFLGKIQAVETTQSECSSERLARFVKLQSDNALANYYYSVNLWKRRTGPDDARTLTQAEFHLKRAVELDPTLGVGYLQLGILYFERKDFANAISSYEKAIKAAPELEEAHYRLSQAYKRTGDKRKAEEELQFYNQISKKKDEEVERERRESRQFVYTLRSPASGSQPQ
jgi:tetratricopeptide (TPR) repeat protein